MQTSTLQNVFVAAKLVGKPIIGLTLVCFSYIKKLTQGLPMVKLPVTSSLCYRLSFNKGRTGMHNIIKIYYCM